MDDCIMFQSLLLRISDAKLACWKNDAEATAQKVPAPGQQLDPHFLRFLGTTLKKQHDYLSNLGILFQTTL